MMRPITGATALVFLYTAITSHWITAYNEVIQMINLRNVAPEAVPGFAQNIWKYSFLVVMRYTNTPFLLFGLLLLCATLITMVSQVRDDLDLT